MRGGGPRPSYADTVPHTTQNNRIQAVGVIDYAQKCCYYAQTGSWAGFVAAAAAISCRTVAVP